MKLAISNRVPVNYDSGTVAELLRFIETKVNSLAEERIAAHHGARTAAPSAGSWQQGDFVRNSAPTEAGSAASKYVILGWVCTTSGTPGTWKEARVLTGN